MLQLFEISDINSSTSSHTSKVLWSIRIPTRREQRVVQSSAYLTLQQGVLSVRCRVEILKRVTYLSFVWYTPTGEFLNDVVLWSSEGLGMINPGAIYGSTRKMSTARVSDEGQLNIMDSEQKVFWGVPYGPQMSKLQNEVHSVLVMIGDMCEGGEVLEIWRVQRGRRYDILIEEGKWLELFHKSHEDFGNIREKLDNGLMDDFGFWEQPKHESYLPCKPASEGRLMNDGTRRRTLDDGQDSHTDQDVEELDSQLIWRSRTPKDTSLSDLPLTPAYLDGTVVPWAVLDPAKRRVMHAVAASGQHLVNKAENALGRGGKPHELTSCQVLGVKEIVKSPKDGKLFINYQVNGTIRAPDNEAPFKRVGFDEIAPWRKHSLTVEQLDAQRTQIEKQLSSIQRENDREVRVKNLMVVANNMTRQQLHAVGINTSNEIKQLSDHQLKSLSSGMEIVSKGIDKLDYKLQDMLRGEREKVHGAKLLVCNGGEVIHLQSEHPLYIIKAMFGAFGGSRKNGQLHSALLFAYQQAKLLGKKDSMDSVVPESKAPRIMQTQYHDLDCDTWHDSHHAGEKKEQDTTDRTKQVKDLVSGGVLTSRGIPVRKFLGHEGSRRVDDLWNIWKKTVGPKWQSYKVKKRVLIFFTKTVVKKRDLNNVKFLDNFLELMNAPYLYSCAIAYCTHKDEQRGVQLAGFNDGETVDIRGPNLQVLQAWYDVKTSPFRIEATVHCQGITDGDRLFIQGGDENNFKKLVGRADGIDSAKAKRRLWILYRTTPVSHQTFTPLGMFPSYQPQDPKAVEEFEYKRMRNSFPLAMSDLDVGACSVMNLSFTHTYGADSKDLKRVMSGSPAANTIKDKLIVKGTNQVAEDKSLMIGKGKSAEMEFNVCHAAFTLVLTMRIGGSEDAKNEFTLFKFIQKEMSTGGSEKERVLEARWNPYDLNDLCRWRKPSNPKRHLNDVGISTGNDITIAWNNTGSGATYVYVLGQRMLRASNASAPVALLFTGGLGLDPMGDVVKLIIGEEMPSVSGAVKRVFLSHNSLGVEDLYSVLYPIMSPSKEIIHYPDGSSKSFPRCLVRCLGHMRDFKAAFKRLPAPTTEPEYSTTHDGMHFFGNAALKVDQLVTTNTGEETGFKDSKFTVILRIKINPLWDLSKAVIFSLGRYDVLVPGELVKVLKAAKNRSKTDSSGVDEDTKKTQDGYVRLVYSRNGKVLKSWYSLDDMTFQNIPCNVEESTGRSKTTVFTIGNAQEPTVYKSIEGYISSVYLFDDAFEELFTEADSDINHAVRQIVEPIVSIEPAPMINLSRVPFPFTKRKTDSIRDQWVEVMDDSRADDRWETLKTYYKTNGLVVKMLQSRPSWYSGDAYFSSGKMHKEYIVAYNSKYARKEPMSGDVVKKFKLINPLNGSLDEVRVWNKAIAADIIKTELRWVSVRDGWEEGAKVDEDDCRHCWTFTGGSCHDMKSSQSGSAPGAVMAMNKPLKELKCEERYGRIRCFGRNGEDVLDWCSSAHIVHPMKVKLEYSANSSATLQACFYSSAVRSDPKRARLPLDRWSHLAVSYHAQWFLRLHGPSRRFLRLHDAEARGRVSCRSLDYVGPVSVEVLIRIPTLLVTSNLDSAMASARPIQIIGKGLMHDAARDKGANWSGSDPIPWVLAMTLSKAGASLKMGFRGAKKKGSSVAELRWVEMPSTVMKLQPGEWYWVAVSRTTFTKDTGTTAGTSAGEADADKDFKPDKPGGMKSDDGKQMQKDMGKSMAKFQSKVDNALGKLTGQFPELEQTPTGNHFKYAFEVRRLRDGSVGYDTKDVLRDLDENDEPFPDKDPGSNKCPIYVGGVGGMEKGSGPAYDSIFVDVGEIRVYNGNKGVSQGTAGYPVDYHRSDLKCHLKLDQTEGENTFCSVSGNLTGKVIDGFENLSEIDVKTPGLCPVPKQPHSEIEALKLRPWVRLSECVGESPVSLYINGIRQKRNAVKVVDGDSLAWGPNQLTIGALQSEELLFGDLIRPVNRYIKCPFSLQFKSLENNQQGIAILEGTPMTCNELARYTVASKPRQLRGVSEKALTFFMFRPPSTLSQHKSPPDAAEKIREYAGTYDHGGTKPYIASGDSLPILADEPVYLLVQSSQLKKAYYVEFKELEQNDGTKTLYVELDKKPTVHNQVRMQLRTNRSLATKSERAYGTSQYFSGCLDELRVWKGTRTAEQINDFLFTTTDSTDDMIMYYQFEGVPRIPRRARFAEDVAASTDGSRHQKEAGEYEDLVKWVRDGSGNRNNLLLWGSGIGTVNRVISTAPIGKELALVRGALRGSENPFNAYSFIAGRPAVTEYADTQYDNLGNPRAVLKRIYSYVGADGALHRVTGHFVATLRTEWVSQQQGAPKVLGYIEGAPPIPSENCIFEDADGCASVEFVKARDVTESYGMNIDKGQGRSYEASLALGLGAKDILIAPLGIGISMTITGGFDVTRNFSTDRTKSEEVETSLSSTTTQGLTFKATGVMESSHMAKNPQIGARFLFNNDGVALVQSYTVDVFSQRLEQPPYVLVSYMFKNNPDIPKDWNIVTFPINPRYTKQGTLDGKIGYDQYGRAVYDEDYEGEASSGAYGEFSYFKPTEAYRLKRMLAAERKEQTREEMQKMEACNKAMTAAESKQGMSSLGGNILGFFPTESQRWPKALQKEQADGFGDVFSKMRGTGNGGPAATERGLKKLNRKDLQAITQRLTVPGICNTYVWTAAGGFYKETVEPAGSFTETLSDAFDFSASGGGGMNMNVECSGTSLDANLSGTSDMKFTASSTRTSEMSDSWNLEVVCEVPANIIKYVGKGGFTGRKTATSGEEDSNIIEYDRNTGKPKKMPGKVDAFRFMSFFISERAENTSDLFFKVIDPLWILQSMEQHATIMRPLYLKLQTTPTNVGKSWRVLHRVTFVSRILPDFTDGEVKIDSLEYVLKDFNFGNHRNMVKMLAPHCENASNKADLDFRLTQAIEVLMPEAMAYFDEVRAMMADYLAQMNGGVPPDDAPDTAGGDAGEQGAGGGGTGGAGVGGAAGAAGAAGTGAGGNEQAEDEMEKAADEYEIADEECKTAESELKTARNAESVAKAEADEARKKVTEKQLEIDNESDPGKKAELEKELEALNKDANEKMDQHAKAKDDAHDKEKNFKKKRAAAEDAFNNLKDKTDEANEAIEEYNKKVGKLGKLGKLVKMEKKVVGERKDKTKKALRLPVGDEYMTETEEEAAGIKKVDDGEPKSVKPSTSKEEAAVDEAVQDMDESNAEQDKIGKQIDEAKKKRKDAQMESAALQRKVDEKDQARDDLVRAEDDAAAAGKDAEAKLAKKIEADADLEKAKQDLDNMKRELDAKKLEGNPTKEEEERFKKASKAVKDAEREARAADLDADDADRKVRAAKEGVQKAKKAMTQLNPPVDPDSSEEKVIRENMSVAAKAQDSAQKAAKAYADARKKMNNEMRAENKTIEEIERAIEKDPNLKKLKEKNEETAKKAKEVTKSFNKVKENNDPDVKKMKEANAKAQLADEERKAAEGSWKANMKVIMAKSEKLQKAKKVLKDLQRSAGGKVEDISSILSNARKKMSALKGKKPDDEATKAKRKEKKERDRKPKSKIDARRGDRDDRKKKLEEKNKRKKDGNDKEKLSR